MVRSIAYKFQQVLAVVDIKVALPYLLTGLWLTGYAIIKLLSSLFIGLVFDVLQFISIKMKYYMIYLPVNFIKQSLNLNNTISYMLFVISLVLFFKLLSKRSPLFFIKSKTVQLLLIATAVWLILLIRVF